jgi:hypothetical protein
MEFFESDIVDKAKKEISQTSVLQEMRCLT